nr:MAG TPA: hypothetical protein [Bacteriophage sp.]DAJ53094.1 MAG TPA: hypothetical protein [Caudoviricetes sp.]
MIGKSAPSRTFNSPTLFSFGPRLSCPRGGLSV